MSYLLRSFVWVIFGSAVVIANASVRKTLRHGPAGRGVLGPVEFVELSLFFRWSIRYSKAGNPGAEPFSAAIKTALFWIGSGVSPAFYFSSTTLRIARPTER
jgi:hypothetical protein